MESTSEKIRNLVYLRHVIMDHRQYQVIQDEWHVGRYLNSMHYRWVLRDASHRDIITMIKAKPWR